MAREVDEVMFHRLKSHSRGRVRWWKEASASRKTMNL
jgi:hypothetical protein